MTDSGRFEMSMSRADILLDAINTILDRTSLPEEKVSQLTSAITELYDIAEETPTVVLPKTHQFYTTYSRAGYFREDVIRALNDAGIKYREQE